jgi:hypothetical protein
VTVTAPVIFGRRAVIDAAGRYYRNSPTFGCRDTVHDLFRAQYADGIGLEATEEYRTLYKAQATTVAIF